MTTQESRPDNDDVAIYHEHVEALNAATTPGRSIIDISLHQAILTLEQRLQGATEAYAAASANLAEAQIREHDSREMHEAFLTRRRAEAHAAGLPGSNESARAAALAEILRQDGDIAFSTADLSEQRDARIMADHHFRVADIAVKSLRARLYAMTALLAKEA